MASATFLTSLGWRAVGARPSDRLPSLWQELGRRAGGIVDSRAERPGTATTHGVAAR